MSSIAKLRAPIVLVHGFFGYSRVRVAGMTLTSYFPRIPELLEAGGNRVLVPWLSATSGIADRAAQLKAFLDRESPSEPVHLFAHSMGGLDSRYMIAHLGMSERVLTLTTLGTPHRGCCLADWGINRLERMLKPVFNLFDVPTQAVYDLTRGHCAQFNRETPDASGVRYFSVIGQPTSAFLNPQLIVSHQLVLPEEGPNDGVVSDASARYGEHVDVWDCDHLSMVNWQNPWYRFTGSFNPAANYGQLVGRLADEGY